MEYYRGLELAERFTKLAREAMTVARVLNCPDARRGELGVAKTYLQLALNELNWFIDNSVYAVPPLITVGKSLTLLSAT